MSNILFGPDNSTYWWALVHSYVDILFGQRTAVEQIIFKTGVQDNPPNLIQILTTNDGETFVFNTEVSIIAKSGLKYARL